MNDFQQGRSYFEVVSEAYSASDQNEESLFWQRYDLRRMRELLPIERSYFVDLGCGHGTYSAILAHDFTKSIIVDWALPPLSLCNRRMRCDDPSALALCGDIRSLAFRRKHFASFVLASGAALCYQPHALEAGLRLASSILAPNGIIYLEAWSRLGLLLSRSTAVDNIGASDIILPELHMYLRDGVATEMCAGNKTNRYTFRLKDVIEVARETGLHPTISYGRKLTKILLDNREYTSLLTRNPHRLMEMERELAEYDDLSEIAPKFVLILQKEKKST